MTIIGREFVLSDHDTPTLLDVIEEPLDQVACAIGIGAEADRAFARVSAIAVTCPLVLDRELLTGGGARCRLDVLGRKAGKNLSRGKKSH